MNGSFVIKENNNKIICNILGCFKLDNENYIFFNDGSKNEDGSLKVLVNKFTLNNSIIKLYDIDENKLDIIEKKWNDLYEKQIFIKD